MPVSTALLIAGAVMAVALAVGLIARAQDGRRRSGGAVRVSDEDLPNGRRTGITLVQFSTELCARCPQVRRLLGEIASANGIARAEIDLTRSSDLAAKYHVLQTPTTFLIDASGKVAARWGGVPDHGSITEAITTLRAASRTPRERQEQS
ncbi:TlpA family protein disulfide reductase [Microbacterium sp.]|uniref:TlpA family protein disulfide reductase n=1 Tax=Microbacterium sp. TaxID=51671 RepID=UPI003A8EC970